MKEFEKYGDVTKVEFMKCELENLKQVNAVAKELSKLPKIDAVRDLPTLLYIESEANFWL